MHCPACHVLNADDHRFCENCGTGLPRLCPGCGHECGPSAKFCGNCGTGLGGKPAPVAAPQTSGWAELKSATILFADIVSSTEQIDGLDPEQTMGRLRPAIAQMCRTIESFGGTVVSTLGDGIMAIFGAPRALEGHARLSCQAALALQGVFQRESESQGFSIRVGLHSGQVAADPLIADGVIGPDVYGHAIHLASRVVGLADPGGVCITSATLALIRQECEVRAMGFHRLKGIAEPVEIHAVLRIRNELESLQFHQPALSAFRGRASELDILEVGVRNAEAGNGTVIGVSGVPGAGKSRLCSELARWCREQQITVYKVRTEPYGHAAPLQSVLALMRTCFFQITAADDAVATRNRIAERLAALGPPVAEDQALLNEFFSVAEAGATPCTLNPKARRTRLLELVRLLTQLVSKQTLVIVFEDLHWLDEASEEFLATLVEATAGAHLLLLLNYRRTFKAPWIGLPHVRQLDLAELNADDVGELVVELLASRRELQDAVPLIVARAAGNPFFAEELTRTLISSALDLPAGSDPRRLEVIAQALPVTVQAVIGERIDRLVGSQKAVLHICAVIGKEVPQALLQQVAISLASQLERELDNLCEAELLLLLREITSGRRFAFRHPLIQEVAYSTQLKTRRAELHAAVAVAMENYYRGQPDEHAALIAFHYAVAGKNLNAAKYEAIAAEWVGATDSGRSIKHWHKVRSLLQDVLPSDARSQLWVTANSKICWLGWREGLTLEDVQSYLDEALALSDKVDVRFTQLLTMFEGRILHASGGPADQYVNRVEKALGMLRPDLDLSRMATLNGGLCQAYSWAGMLEKALGASNEAIRNIEHIEKFDFDIIGFDIRQWIYSLRGRLLNRLGMFDESELCLQEQMRLAKDTADPVIATLPRYGCLELAYFRNDLNSVNEFSKNLFALVSLYDSHYLKVYALNGGGLAGLIAGDGRLAIHYLSEALALIKEKYVAIELETEILANLADGYMKVGDFDRARFFAEKAIKTSRERNHRLPECRALITLASVEIREFGSVKIKNAEGLFLEAKRLIEITGIRVYDNLWKNEWVAMGTLL